MVKRRIHLTESQLHRLVEQALNEIMRRSRNRKPLSHIVTESVMRKLRESADDEGEYDDEDYSIFPAIYQIASRVDDKCLDFLNQLTSKYGEDYDEWPRDDYWHETQEVVVEVDKEIDGELYKGGVKFKLWIEPYFGYAPEDMSIIADYIDSNLWTETNGQKIPYHGDGKLTDDDLYELDTITVGSKHCEWCGGISLYGKTLSYNDVSLADKQ